jgi:hypothetical protein
MSPPLPLGVLFRLRFWQRHRYGWEFPIGKREQIVAIQFGEIASTE